MRRRRRPVVSSSSSSSHHLPPPPLVWTPSSSSSPSSLDTGLLHSAPPPLLIASRHCHALKPTKVPAERRGRPVLTLINLLTHLCHLILCLEQSQLQNIRHILDFDAQDRFCRLCCNQTCHGYDGYIKIISKVIKKITVNHSLGFYPLLALDSTACCSQEPVPFLHIEGCCF